MINFMVANMQPQLQRYVPERIELLVKAQIENSIELGWHKEDIVIVANFNFEFMGVKTIKTKLNNFCQTGSKIFALYWYMKNGIINDVIWSHDLDAWASVPFGCPDFEKDVGGTQYNNFKWNGGSTFWTPRSFDIVEEILRRLVEGKEPKEEPTLNRVFKSKEYRDRISVVNHTYNVGCSGYVPRFKKSLLPIRVCHFHPYNGVAWEIHALDRDGAGCISVSPRLEKLLRKYYPLATELRPRKKKKKKPLLLTKKIEKQ